MYIDMMNFFAETASGIVESLIICPSASSWRGKDVRMCHEYPLRISPATSLAHNTSVLLASAIRCRHQVQYHLGLWRQLSFYDRPCILRALLPGLGAVRREALTPVRVIITERSTPFSLRRETINAVLQKERTPVSLRRSFREL